MKKDVARKIEIQMKRALTAPQFLAALPDGSVLDIRRLWRSVDWDDALEKRFPLSERLSCTQILGLCRPFLKRLAPEPEEGWLTFAYHTAAALLFPKEDLAHTAMQKTGALLYLRILQVLLDEERRELPFDPRLDFDFCTEEELRTSFVTEEYRRFQSRFREEYVYEMMRIGREITPFRTLDHIAGVHHVAMTIARTYAAKGGPVDLALTSGAAAGHDIGKFGCKPGEQVPYLHYHYTDQWFAQRGMRAIGHIAANHSVWDLELENLSAESLILVYSDFRVKQLRDSAGNEIAHIYSLQEAFDIILGKLDNVDAVKERRYRFVYAKLHDFESYLVSFGVDVSLRGHDDMTAQTIDPALLTPEGVVAALRYTAVDHNIRLMYRLSHDELFVRVLESARSEKDWGRLRAYVSVFEEYFTYLTAAQKEQTLDFLYELLVHPNGDIRRQAALLMGRILAGFHSGYKKERPDGAPPDPENGRCFTLWADYLERLITPDRRLTPRQTSTIRYTAKLVAKSLLEHCSDTDGPRFTEELLRHYCAPAEKDPDTAFALLDTVTTVPADRCDDHALSALTEFAFYWLQAGELSHKAAALELFSHLLSSAHGITPYEGQISMEIRNMDCAGSAPVLFLRNRLLKSLGVPAEEEVLLRPETISSVFLDNLKSATHWILKAAGVEYLLTYVGQGSSENIMHVAAHFSNLIKVSENVIVRRMAGASLLTLAPSLSPDGRNEIAVELSKALETGQTEISQYIPEYLGQFSLWLSPRELDEVIEEMRRLLSSANSNVVAAALSTVGSMLEHYLSYAVRFPEPDNVFLGRRKRLAGLLLKGLASRQPAVRQEALRILGEGLFASKILSHQEKTNLFTLMAKKILCLINEYDERQLTFFYTAAALSHIYRFIVFHTIESGAFAFQRPQKAAFFPGTFDPFSLSHKGIVQDIRNRGFEVYLAIDEFSWSKKTQPGLIRRALVSMSVADEFDVYVFPHDIPVNLSNPEDLNTLRRIFSGRELYLVVGSDVVANASAYRTTPSPDSVHSMNHIIFRRKTSSAEDGDEADLSGIQGKVLELQLPTYLEDISSTHIRDNIDMGRDISTLIDPAVQDYIYRNSLYLREPQYKKLIRPEYPEVSMEHAPSAALRRALAAALDGNRKDSPLLDPSAALVILRDGETQERPLGCLSMREINSEALFGILRDAEQANYIREHSAGRICLISGLFTAESGLPDAAQLLITDALSLALRDDCCYAVYAPPRASGAEETVSLLRRQGFTPVPGSGECPLLLTDMRAPVALLQNIPTTLKEPFVSAPAVRDAVRSAHWRMQDALTNLYPGTLILSLSAEVIYHRLVKKIVEINGVPAKPAVPRQLGEKMCVPFGKILRGNTVPNTVTKTLHTDKVFAPDLKSFSISPFPGYAPLSSQIRTIKSFRRPVILVDDLLHSGSRIRALEPMFCQYGVYVDRVLVGLLSGRGRDLTAACGWEADCVYFVPNLRSWFVESTMYPFIGGDTVRDARPSVPGLTPAVNLILPYAFPRFYKECDRAAVYEFSRVCLENSRDILLALEGAYRARFSRGLTLSRLSEAVILPLSPDKGNSLRYDPSLSASECLNEDLQSLFRMRDLLE